VDSYTVRPHGHPFHRRLRLAEDLRSALTRDADTLFVVVDEGPGLSGSSFAAVAEALSELGVADERIVFMPAWVPDGSSFLSREASERWQRHAKYAADTAAPEVPCEHRIELSAGAWRQIFYADECEYPAVQPQHEVRKFLCRADEALTITRFAGLARYGQEKLDRARTLAEAGFSMAPIRLEEGWLMLEFVPGRPLVADDVCDELIDRMAAYIAFRGRAFATGAPCSTDALADMIRVNANIDPPPAPAGAEAVITDGRMMPHEWIAASAGYLKTDALDHGDNHFLPGPTDICWDLAGAMIEWQLDESGRARLLEQYVRESADRDAPERLQFYLIAYAAFRMGYTRLAITALPPSAERERMEALYDRYVEQIEKETAEAVAGKAMMA